MFPYKVVVLLFLALLPTEAWAQKHLINISYWNWGEEFRMSRGDEVQMSNSNFSALGLEYEFSSGLADQGWTVSPSFLLGQATGGDTNGDLVYVASYQKFFGLAVKAAWFWRFERRIYLEVGPFAIYRQLAWPASDDGIHAESGPVFNNGFVANLRVRLTPNIDFCQSFGAILTKGSSLWSAGFGYRF